jgi:hypothetical protein
LFKPGDYVFDKTKNERVQILAASEAWGFVSYKVYCPSDDMVYKLSEDAISATPSEDVHNANYLRYVVLLSKIKSEIAGGVVSKLATGIIPLPHQIHVAPFVIRTEKRDAIDNNGNRLFKNRKTKAVALMWDKRHTMQAEMDFTDAYMKSLGKPYCIEENITPVEDDLRNQLENRIKIKELIHEDKDLGLLVGSGMNFDLDESLRMMMGYYERSAGNPTPDLDTYTLTDPVIKWQLKRDLEFDPDSNVMRVTIRDFPNEAGYFMLWKLSVSSDEQSHRFVPVFINEDFVARPLAGGRIWEALLDENKQVTVSNGGKLDCGIFARLSEEASKFAFDAFTKLKDETVARHAETHRKRMYAISVRMEAAQRIGIENIRNHKLTQLENERREAERQYEADKMLCPEFHPILFAFMVSGNA